MGEWRYSSTFLDLGTSWRRVVSFTSRGKRPRYPLNSRLGGPQSRSRRCGEERNVAPSGNRTPVIQLRRYTDWAQPNRPIHCIWLQYPEGAWSRKVSNLYSEGEQFESWPGCPEVHFARSYRVKCNFYLFSWKKKRSDWRKRIFPSGNWYDSCSVSVQLLYKSRSLNENVNIIYNEEINKKFWEELIAYFP
jgi:hypothetical protein